MTSPDRAFAFSPRDTFKGGLTSFATLAHGDLDADGHTDLMLSGYTRQTNTLTGRYRDGNYSVVWGHPDGRPQRATWFEGHGTDSVLPLLTTLDRRPGDELVLVWEFGLIEVWTHADGTLKQTFSATLCISGVYGNYLLTRLSAPQEAPRP